VVDQDID